MNRAARAAATLALLILAPAAGAQPATLPAPEPANLRGASTQTLKRLLEIRQKLATGKHADAADDLQRLLDESGNDLIPAEANPLATPGASSARPARWLAHQLLAKLDRDTLKAYQDRIDQPAQKLLARAKETRDPAPLYQLLERYFVSRAADEGLLLLGDLQFERGEFRAAEATWRQLLPDAGAELVYPNAKADPAQVRARIVLAVIFARDLARAKAELDEFKVKHPNATGPFAGRTGPLADTLKAALDARPQLAPEAPTGEWPTYGGSPERTGRVPGGVPRDWSAPPWVKAISANPLFPRPGPDAPPARPPFGHPVIVNGEVFVADATRVFRFDLRSGAAGASHALMLAGIGGGPTPGACASLTAADGRLYARYGPPVVRAPENTPKGAQEESFLFCVRPDPQRIKELWKLAPPEDRKVPAVWEGAPLVVGKRLWAVYAKYEGGRVIHVAAGYDPVGDTAPERPAWTTELCDSTQPVSGDGRTRQEILTLSGRHLIFCSNTGAVVALDAATGQRAWGFRYPRARKPNPSADPAPAVAFGGRVFVAPADGERVYCLDAVTGQPVWESGPTEGARIIGVARGRLVVSTAGPVRSLRGLSLDTGSYRREDGGWIQDRTTLPYGQGLVTDDVILWPSRAGLTFVDPETGLPTPGTPNPLPPPAPRSGALEFFGNVAYADGVLVVVTHAQVWGYRSESRKIVPRPDSTPGERFHWFIDRAERALARGDTGAAFADLADLTRSDLPLPFRAWAAARAVTLSPRVANREQLPPAVQALLQPALMGEWVLDAAGVPVTLETVLARHLGSAPTASAPATASAHKLCAPALTPEAEIAHTLKLPAGVSPLAPIAGASVAPRRLFAAGPDKLVGVPLDQSAETAHAVPELFTHASELRDGFVAVGPKAVALYGAGRDPVWVFRVPVTARLADGPLPFHLRSADDPLAPYLSSFRLAGAWLFARLGEFHLVALDLGARRVAWVLAATGQSGYQPNHFATTPRFGPHFATVGKFLVAQLSDGTRWFVQVETGRPAPQPALGSGTALVSWPHPPVEVGESELLLADGAGRVRLVSFGESGGGPALALPLLGGGRVRLLPHGGRVKWRFDVDRSDGLAGEPPQVRAFGDLILIAVRRNHGVEIECVSLADGKPVWDEPAFADADRVDLANADADADHIYLPVGNELVALARKDGKPAWAAPLPGSRGTEWAVRVGETYLVAHPTRAVPREPTETVLARLTRSFEREPQVWRLPGLLATAYDAWVDRAAPVALLDPETGKRAGLLEVPGRGPALAVRFGPGAAVLATGDRVVWLK